MAVNYTQLTKGTQSPVVYNLTLDSDYVQHLKTKGHGGDQWAPGPQFYREGNILVATKDSLENQELPSDPIEAVVAMNGEQKLNPEEWAEKFVVIGLTRVPNDPNSEVIPMDSHAGIAVRAGGGGQMFAAVKDGEGIQCGQMFKVVAPEMNNPPLPYKDSTFDNNNTGRGKQYIPQIVPVHPNKVVESWNTLGKNMINEKTPPFKDSKSFRGTLDSKQKTAFVTKNGLLGMAFNIIQKLVDRNIIHISAPDEEDVYQSGGGTDTAIRLAMPRFFSATDMNDFNLTASQRSDFDEKDNNVSQWKEDRLMWLASLLGLTGLEGDYDEIFDKQLMTECVAAGTFGLAGGLLNDTYLYPKTKQGTGRGWDEKVSKLRERQVLAPEDFMCGVSEATSSEIDKIFGVALTNIPPNQKNVERVLVKQIG